MKTLVSVILTGILTSGLLVAQSVTSIPAGTEIQVRTIDAIDSKTADPNRKYAASLAEPLMVNGVQLAPRNADVQLRVVQNKKAGMVSGRTDLVLDVSAIKINGQMVLVETGTTVKESSSQAGKTAKRGLIGSAAGAAIGAIAGGGKGAAIGAGAGGAAGVASAAISGERVKVPAETRLTFALSSEVPLTTPQSETTSRSAPNSRTQVLGGWAVTVESCDKRGNATVVCTMLFANTQKDRSLWVSMDSNIIDADGNLQKAIAGHLGSATESGGFLTTTVIPEAPVKCSLQFPLTDNVNMIGRLKVNLRWNGGEGAAEFREVPISESGR